MLKLLRISLVCIISICSACAPKVIYESPLDVPDVWRNPEYEKLLTGWFSDGRGNLCLTQQDAERVVRNKDRCEKIRSNIVQFLDDPKGGDTTDGKK